MAELIKQYSSVKLNNVMKINDEEFKKHVLRKEDILRSEKELTEEEKYSIYVTP